LPERDESSERRFVERLMARDERAFNELVQLYQRRVYLLVLRMLGRPDEAEDMAQEVFVQVFKAIGQFRGESKLSTWLYRIAVNLCKNRAKYLGRRHTDRSDAYDGASEYVDASAAEGVTLAQVARPDHLLEGYELERIVQACIADLEPDFREVLVLCDVEELSYEEIGQITGLADGTVKSRIFRARALLKSKVERALGEKLR
jgi:RNA polymerase sigma-70 factor (ECF subfamily)